MKVNYKNVITFLLVTIIFSSLIAVNCFAQSDITVGLCFDVGGKGDKSFNDSASRGLSWAAQDFGIKRIELEPGADADREVNLRNLASIGYNLIIGVGFLFTDSISDVADEFPDTKFAIVDGFIPDKPNVVSLNFAEHEGSFLVGMIAGLKALQDGKDTVGFVGGMNVPLIQKFEAGYLAGVKYAYPDCKILSAYAGDTDKAFADPVKGKELALSQYDNDAYVIYHASGLTGAGVYEAAKERKRYVIGVDSNQNYLGYIEETGENFGLTSMLKQVDVSVYLTVKSVIEDTFEPGIRLFDLATSVVINDVEYNGVGYAMDKYNQDLVSEDVLQKVEEAKAKIIKGEILIPAEL
ncbi:MAG: BMP family ABC transporter substrate-binding protein [Atribacterota bacterium]|jgi:basic membrane protein A|nr:BMP family ABC transporter substrate-binding protein [Atribacterota bacterium]MDD4895421.1 BMP family ABC transporter substrate-binding protein [Atribacterota bacterium]MDD5636271.1 BMP family ABC transporter substrate-binding protein [Atribacterota bacterium]